LGKEEKTRPAEGQQKSIEFVKKSPQREEGAETAYAGQWASDRRGNGVISRRGIGGSTGKPAGKEKRLTAAAPAL